MRDGESKDRIKKYQNRWFQIIRDVTCAASPCASSKGQQKEKEKKREGDNRMAVRVLARRKQERTIGM